MRGPAWRYGGINSACFKLTHYPSAAGRQFTAAGRSASLLRGTGNGARFSGTSSGDEEAANSHVETRIAD